MKQFCIRFLRLIFGLFLYSFGTVITLNADIGYAPWEVFHVGLAKTTGISIGTASIITGFFIIIINILLKEKLGIGTILNMILIGSFLDLIIGFHIIPHAVNLLSGIIMLITGLFVIAIASYFYIGSAFGAGPRDSLMVALARITGFPVGLCRGIIESIVVLAGWKLSGTVGIGTIISAFSIGFCIQITFKLLKFDPTKIEHETIEKTYKMIFKNQTE
jgi:uncharacterized membrane protein YczE